MILSETSSSSERIISLARESRATAKAKRLAYRIGRGTFPEPPVQFTSDLEYQLDAYSFAPRGVTPQR